MTLSSQPAKSEWEQYEKCLLMGIYVVSLLGLPISATGSLGSFFLLKLK